MATIHTTVKATTTTRSGAFQRRRSMTSSRIVAWCAIAPAAIALILVVGYPALDGLRLSFSSWVGLGEPEWIGFDNYVQAIGSSEMRTSLLLTMAYAVGSAVIMVALATLLAAAISGGARGSAFYRVVWFLPGVAPATAVAVFWSASFQPGTGSVNAVLGALGLGNDHAWLASQQTAIYPVIGVTVWSGAGFAFLLLLGAMEQIPVSVFEAASIDGASSARKFFSITLPLVRPVLVICLMLEIIWAANGFSVVYAMTQGGPGTATETLPLLIYKQAFSLSNYGLASAMAVISGVILIVIGLVSLRFSRSRQGASW
ncbi:MAG: sugar transporter permease [Microbacteriaceae bacterium]|nr:sugar transporter permease [Microbacteriaceae bacterium]